ncbi:MAG: cation:proton antiporter [Archangium sp.]|nr:cation:proton antiporter [Archangium sp.]
MPHLELNALTLLLAQMVLIIAVARTLTQVTRRLGQPAVIAEVLAGIVLGPSLLGLLAPAVMNAVFPASSMAVLRMMSQFGLILFMFLVGLEFDPRLLQGRARASVAISHASILVPFVLGVGLAAVLFATYAEPNVPKLSFFLFFGIALSVTAFPVLARILSERNLLTSRIGAIAIACAAVDDVTAWCLLAFVVAVARAHALGDALWTTGLALSFIALMIWVVRPFLRRLGSRVGPDGLSPGALVICLLLLLVSAGVTEAIGIHALFGAFLFGAVLPKEGSLSSALAEKLETVATSLLLPLFFAYSGLRTQIGLLASPSEWAVTFAIIAVATLGKFGGSSIAARLTGLTWRESTAVGVLMNTRGLMELIVLNIGLDLGVISPTVFTMMVVMALVTTFTTTPVLRLVYPDSQLAAERLLPVVPPQARPLSFGVLMCVSDGRNGPVLAVLADALRGDGREPPRLTALHLQQPADRTSRVQPPSRPPLEPLVERARQLALEVKTLSYVSTDAAEDICRTAEMKRASLIMLGWHKPLLIEGRLGGTVGEVVSKAPCPVGVFVDRGLERVERVLVAFAGGPEDHEALRFARRMALTPGVSLTLLHVVAPGDGAPGRGRVQIDEVFGPQRDEPGLRLAVVEHDDPPEAALAEASRGYDLVVLGMNDTWGTTGGPFVLHRQRVLTDCSVSVLALHPGVAPEPVATGRLAADERATSAG